MGKTVTLKWDRVKGAESYQILRYMPAEKRYRGVKVVPSKTAKISFREVLRQNMDYRYSVYAFKTVKGERVKSKACGVVVYTMPAPAVKITSAKQSSNGSCTVTWKPNSHAHGYRVYRAQAGGKWQQVKILRGSTETRFVDTSLKRGVTYYYRIRPFCKNMRDEVLGALGNMVKMNAYAFPTPTPTPVSPTNIIFVGDSRTVMMEDFVNGGSKTTQWIAKVGAGYVWLRDTASYRILDAAKKGSVVFLWFGVNDVYQISNYVKYYNSLITQLNAKGAKVYVASVGQVNGDPYVTNSEIASFNSKLKSGVKGSAGFIDVYGYLSSAGYRTTDGTHYDSATSKKIYNYMLQRAGIS